MSISRYSGFHASQSQVLNTNPPGSRSNHANNRRVDKYVPKNLNEINRINRYNVVLESVQYSELENVINNLISKLDSEKHESLISQLSGLADTNSIRIPGSSNSLLIPKKSLITIRDCLANILKKLRSKELDNLQTKDIPQSLKVTLKLAKLYRKIDQASNLRDLTLRSKYLRNFAIDLAHIDSIDKVLEVIDNIPDNNQKIRALAYIGKVLNDKNDNDGFKVVSQRIFKISSSLKAQGRFSEANDLVRYFFYTIEQPIAQVNPVESSKDDEYKTAMCDFNNIV